MRSIADDLRVETRTALARLTPDERMDLAFRLGDDDVALLCVARGLRTEEARRVFARARRHGRMPSRDADGGDE
jgi:hypothetical protein